MTYMMKFNTIPVGVKMITGEGGGALNVPLLSQKA